MARVKRSVVARKRRRRVLKAAKGYYGARSKLHRVARQAVERAATEAYRGRKQRKRAFRGLWIARINAASREHGLSYSQLISGLRRADVEIDRKMLAQLALEDPKAFGELAELAKGQAA